MDFTAAPDDFVVADGEAIPMPFDFVLQVAFTSSPPFSTSLQNEDEYTDTSPWEFPAQDDVIQNTVLDSVQTNERAQEILNDVAEFTMLQRFFRLVLNGHLGDRFPVERLAQLNETLENFAPITNPRTLRWNVFPDLEQELRANMTAENREQIQEILALRRDLGIHVDVEQIQQNRGALPPLQ